jgi:hypothetical protein
MEEYKIPLRNKKKEIIDYTLVSKDDYEHLNKLFWNKDRNGYVQGYKSWFLHRYILIELHKIKPTTEKHKIVDHINNNPLDNRLDNLRFVTASENSQNSKKRKNTSSIYKGVSKYRNQWRTSITLNQKYYYAYYENELHAAHQYNLWIDKFKLTTANKNIIDIPNDFIEYTKTNIKKLHQHITKQYNKYKIHITLLYKYLPYYYESFNKLENAIKIRDIILKTKELKQKLNIEIKHNLINEYDQHIIKTNKNEDIVVDKDLYNELNQYIWHKNTQGYASTNINKKTISMTKYILKYNGKDVIDHINGNKLDNRKENLRIVTYTQNAQNKSKRENTTSKYIGVYFRKDRNTWIAEIRVNSKKNYLGKFKTEIEAAKARDIATKKHFGEYGKLNFPA